MADYDATTIALSIFGGGGGLLAAGVFLRDYLKGRVLTDANRDAAINGVGINQQVLANLVDEVDRMKHREIETAAKTETKEAELEGRIEELERRVDELTKRLATVRVMAVDCYSIAVRCNCGCDGHDLLIAHLESIIRES